MELNHLVSLLLLSATALLLVFYFAHEWGYSKGRVAKLNDLNPLIERLIEEKVSLEMELKAQKLKAPSMHPARDWRVN